MGFGGADHVVIATGARWTKSLCQPNELPGGWCEGALTPDDLAAGAEVAGRSWFSTLTGTRSGRGGGVAGRAGLAVTYVTTAGHAGAWSFLTNEQGHVHQALARRGICLRTLELVTGLTVCCAAGRVFLRRGAGGGGAVAGHCRQAGRRVGAV